MSKTGITEKRTPRL